ncbi:MAG: LuxR C-terminal-related transcriptional regulator, partial [Solirubrobacteraceae bacterium]|nr:LuxR C-terminal-related transcriptional regulator [Solirubrobacteraceae bacterium]
HVGDGLWFRASGLDEPLPVGDLIERGFADRLSTVSGGALTGLEVVAASVRDDAATIGSALDHLGVGRAPLAEAERAGIVALGEGRIQFSHPLLRSLVHRRTSPDALRRYHEALAAATVGDIGLHAWHAASAAIEADETIASELDAAANRFAGQGGLRAAAQALARAAELTPDPDARAGRLLRAGRNAQFAGSGTWAAKLFDDALSSTRHLPLLAEAHYLQALLSIHLVPGQDNLARLLDCVEEAERSGDEDLTARVLVTYVYEGMLNGQGSAIRLGFERMERLHGSPHLDPYTADEMTDLAAYIALMLGDEPTLRTPAETLAARSAVREEWLIPTLEALTLVEQFDLASRWHREWIDESRKRGNAFLLSVSLGLDGAHRFRVGDWTGARVQLEESVRVAETTELAAQSAQPKAMLAIVRAGMGDDTVRDEIGEIEELGRRYGLGVNVEFTSSAMGLVELGAGRGPEAVAHYEQARAWKRGAGQAEPTGSPWPADIVDAHLLAGDLPRSRERLEELRAYAERTGRRWAVAAVARLDAALAGDDAFESLFHHALELYAPARDPFGLARAQLAFGQRLRRVRRRVDARAQLTAALDGFERLGAQPWAEQARRELVASGETLRRGAGSDPQALTPQEAQVAELVIGGASNKAVAGALFLSPKTVETHLSRIYRKLGVSSRTQLAVALRTDEVLTT